MKTIIKIAAKSLIFLFLAFWATDVSSQIGKWKTYPAYQNATLVAETPNYVFAVYDGALLSFDPADNEVRTYSSSDGLNGNNILHITYNKAVNAIVIVYSDHNIDIFYGENNVYNFPEIKNDNTIHDKTINNVEIIEDNVYLSTAFGIVVLDLKKKVIKDTYRLGCEVRSVCSYNGFLYAATSEGIKKAPTTSNLLDRENWVPDFNAWNLVDVTKILIFKDKFVFLRPWDILYIDDNKALQQLRYSLFKGAKVLNGQLILLGNYTIMFYSDFNTFTEIAMSAYAIDCLHENGNYWVALGNNGLSGFKKQPATTQYEIAVSGIKVNSPLSNSDFFMRFSNDKLLIVGGGRGINRSTLPGALMVYKDNKWYNFDNTLISSQTGRPCLDFMSVAVDPTNPEHYFVASWGEGLYEFLDNEFVKLYDYDNSSLQTAVPDNNYYIRVDGLTFDKNNNLYMVNGGVQNGLSIRYADGTWKNFYYPALSSSDPNKIVIAKNNLKWFNMWRGTKAGIMVLDDNGTIDDSSDDNVAYTTRFVDQNGYDISATGFLDIVEDKNGVIWVGTDNGPIRLYSMQQVAEGVCNRPVSIDEYGSAFRLMEGLKVNVIAVDAANRKWLGTDNAGLFMVDDQSTPGMMLVENYTTENSLLISDKINSLAINDKTGEIFIGCENGLCSYQMEATVGSEDYSEVYAFPNPVRPSRDNQVVISGLMSDSNIKITDIAGNLIKESKSIGGQFIWNLTNLSGNIVKAGIYLVFASTSEGNMGVVTKIMVIK